MIKRSAFLVAADGGNRNNAQPQIKAPAKTAPTAAVGLWKMKWARPAPIKTAAQDPLISA
ncbi:hypothetical protein [Arthrobacter sp. D5-1]|uniref:hypothetical protein n=1 Tax=Arthrobacter sp. D5-1 TaxID=1477518 RepID=UPI001A982AA3|nr:hypothetical protein [Arthrobacter sp. D5-1]